MSVTDPIADLLTRIRNAVKVLHPTVSIPFSNMKEDIVKLLKQEGFIRDYSVIQEKTGVKKDLEIVLKYSPDNEPVILGLERISRPGRKVYVKKDAIPRVLNGMGFAILSTSKGVMTDRDSKSRGVGGELLCKVW